jgi:hypothetical protein
VPQSVLLPCESRPALNFCSFRSRRRFVVALELAAFCTGWTYTELENDLRQLISSKIPRVFNSTSGPDPETILAELNGKVIATNGGPLIQRFKKSC